MQGDGRNPLVPHADCEMRCGNLGSEEVPAHIVYAFAPDGTRGGANELVMKRYLLGGTLWMCDGCARELAVDAIAARI